MKVHFEPYLVMAAITHKSALVAWGGFYFKVRREEGPWKLMDDSDLDHVHPPRRSSIGAKSDPYGQARVEVTDASGKVVAFGETTTTNHVWVSGLHPDTEYRYRVLVDGQPWAAGPRRDWVLGDDRRGLVESGREYVNVFRTHPHPDSPASLAFAAIGDFGTGVRHPSTGERHQREIAEALERTVEARQVRLVVTTGDNIYAGRTLLGLPVGATGDEDDDWFFTFYQPYRYVVNRVPFYPCIGNHDGNETEVNDDRDQIMDNFFLAERLLGEESAGRASIGPGLFYRFRYGRDIELVCIDSSRRNLLFGDRFFRHVNHRPFLEAAFPEGGAGSPPWRIPFAHHPPYCAGPLWGNSKSSLETLVPLYRRSGVRVVLAGHEHNFQHNRADGIEYFVTGGGGKVRRKTPGGFAEAGTVAWAAEGHFLLLEIAGRQAVVTPIGRGGTVIPASDPGGRPVDPVATITLPAVL
ncbi:MAG TPA: metallophosphoesterase [Vicinamibacteria bacterium]|nr:metallophosphoesterase [Vicinamibacteria bacterium]